VGFISKKKVDRYDKQTRLDILVTAHLRVLSGHLKSNYEVNQHSIIDQQFYASSD